ncbi:MAG: hypothetical protein LWW86_09210 [Micrococcales bacterium]|nr:hypothetical protein [Micrococcales bacterium]
MRSTLPKESLSHAQNRAVILVLAILAAVLAPAFSARPAHAGSYYQYVRSLVTYYGCSSTPVAITSAYGHQGTFDFARNRIYIAPGLSSYRLRYVTAHECAHAKQLRAYGGVAGYWTMQRRMNQIYGGTGTTGLERNADCVTRVLGLTGQRYTTYCPSSRRTAAVNTMYVRRS